MQKPKKHRKSRSKKTIQQTANIIVKEDNKGLLQVQSGDKRAQTSAFNRIKSGKFADLPTLLCDHCRFGAQNNKVGGTGQCEVYQKGAVCGLEHKYRGIVDVHDTREVTTLQDIVDQQIKLRTVRGFLLAQFSTWEGGIPDRLMDRNDTHLRDYIKLQAELIAPRTTAKQTQFKRNADGSMEGLIQEILMSGNKPAEEAPAENTVGMKTPEEHVQDSAEALKKMANENEDISTMM